MAKKIIGSGAEAVIYNEDDIIIKDRVKKEYRIKIIDEKLRKSRTKREAKVLERLDAIGFPAPKLVYNDKKSIIKMELVKGKKLRDVLEDKDYLKLSEEIGQRIADMHNNNIIHGDLTTSNMIMDDKIYFIDFGLSFFSTKPEDMAVDLHLLKQALESKHYRIFENCFKAVLESYKKHADRPDLVIKRFSEVELRGRNKAKV